TLQDRIADGMHQVRLAETDAAVDEQRIVRGAGVLPDLHGGRTGKLVALALDEAVERERGVQAAAEHLGGSRPSFVICGNRGGRRHRSAAGAYLEQHITRARVLRPPRPNLDEAVSLHPIDDETVRREQLDDALAILDGLQRPDPRIELLLRES